jgi:hypothetical protein
MVQGNTGIAFFKDIRFWLIVVAAIALIYMLLEQGSR